MADNPLVQTLWTVCEWKYFRVLQKSISDFFLFTNKMLQCNVALKNWGLFEWQACPQTYYMKNPFSTGAKGQSATDRSSHFSFELNVSGNMRRYILGWLRQCVRWNTFYWIHLEKCKPGTGNQLFFKKR